ncbi:hypothetical protein BJ508DRAFT_418454, partial [Ascobolus immersus RN42]
MSMDGNAAYTYGHPNGAADRWGRAGNRAHYQEHQPKHYSSRKETQHTTERYYHSSPDTPNFSTPDYTRNAHRTIHQTDPHNSKKDTKLASHERTITVLNQGIELLHLAMGHAVALTRNLTEMQTIIDRISRSSPHYPTRDQPRHHTSITRDQEKDLNRNASNIYTKHCLPLLHHVKSLVLLLESRSSFAEQLNMQNLDSFVHELKQARGQVKQGFSRLSSSPQQVETGSIMAQLSALGAPASAWMGVCRVLEGRMAQEILMGAWQRRGMELHYVERL